MNGIDAGEFTYCGDLVGTSTLYANAPGEAYQFLNEFYNTVFGGLAAYQQQGHHRNVYMFSDSLIVSGDDCAAFFRSMCGVHMALLASCLLLRGGMVKGRLQSDPRHTREDFAKMLPQGDSLARANA